MPSVMEIVDDIERLISDEYDRGADRIRQVLEPECDERIEEAMEAARLKGFEEGYDEAQAFFQKEGIEDVKAQAYDLGFAESQAKMDDKKELWRQAGYDAGVDKGMREGFDQGQKQGRLEGRAAERLDATVAASKEVGDKEVTAYDRGWRDKEAEVELNKRRRLGGHGC